MRHREKIQQELNRRLAEVAWYRDYTLNNQDLAKDFFGRIADYVNYIKVNRELKGFVNKLQKTGGCLDVNKKLKKDGDEILKKMETDFESIREIIKNNNVNIKSWEETLPSGYTGALSENQAISLTYKQLESFLKQDEQYVGDIPSHIAEMWSLNGHLDTMVSAGDNEKLKNISESYHQVQNEYKERLRLQGNWISYLRYADYEKLFDVWSYYFDALNPQEFSLLRVELGEILGEGITFPSLPQRDIQKLEQKKQEYLLHINRFNNYLIDRLEQKLWSEETYIWVWDNYGKVLVGMCISIILAFILKICGITVPIDIVNNLLNK